MHLSAIALSLIVLLVLFTAEASSPWCEPPRGDPADWALEGTRLGDSVFLGRVLSVKEVTPDVLSTDNAAPDETEAEEMESISSMAALLELIQAEQERDSKRYDHIVSFDVLKSWKAPLYPVVRTKVRLGSDPVQNAFEVGEIYLVIGRDRDETLYWIRSRCTDAILADWAEEYTQELDELGAAE